MNPAALSLPRPATRQPRSWSLGAYLGFSFALLSVLLTIVLTLVSERTATEQVRTGIGAGLAELASQTSSRLDRSMFERYREVQLMASRIAGPTDLARARLELDSLQLTYPYYAWMGVTDNAGKVLASTRGLLAGADVSGRPWFKNVLKGTNMGDVHEAKLLAKLLDNTSGEPLRFVDIAFQLFNDSGREVGVLGVHLSWQWARDVEDAVFVSVGRNRATELLITSSDGTVLLGPAGVQGTQLKLASFTAAGTGQPGFVTETWPDGRRYLVGYSRDAGFQGYPGLGWRVLVRQPLDEAYAPVRQLQERVIIGGIVAALFFTVLGWGAARLITQPLKTLSQVAGDIEAGQPREVTVEDRYREVSALGASLNSLVRNLQQKEADLREMNASLEQRVDERTRELREAFQRVQDSERRIQTILETAQDAFIGMDFAGRITDWNHRAESLFGWKYDEIVGRPFVATLLPPRYAAAGQAALDQFVASGDAPFVGTSMERLMIDAKGREIPVEVNIGLVNTGKLRFFSAFVHDISHRKEIERLKSEFISTVSHELRTPLTGIYGSLQLLASGMAGDLPADAADLVKLSNGSCERLLRLINDVLDVEKLEAGQVSYETKRQPLLPLVEQAVAHTQAYADGYRVKLLLTQPEPDAIVDADADRIVQVVTNLLSNAAKFSLPDGQVEVTMARTNGRVRVCVNDHGRGVPEEFRNRIFERFAQADGSDRRQKGGTGLGLNICRSIVEAHGGSIGLATDPGVLTVFYFELPLAA